MITILWILGCLISYILMVLGLSELAVANPKRSPEGKLRLNTKGFVLRYLYLSNVAIDDNKKIFPKSSCGLHAGIFFGIPTAICESAAALILFIIFGTIGGFFGYAIDLRSESKESYGPYQRWGKNNEKRFIAPWKIIIPLSAIVLAIIYPKVAWDIFASAISLTVGIFLTILTSMLSLYIAMAILAVFAIYFGVNKIRKTEVFPAAKDAIKSWRKNICTETELV